MQKWEYRFVTCRYAETGGWKPRSVNEEVLADWQSGPTMYAYANSLGEQGWELVSAVLVFDETGDEKAYRLAFKRAKE